MKIPTRVELGVVVLADIAYNTENGGTVTSVGIAERQNISQKYLEQIILGLRQGGFVRSTKGSRGGYQLSRPASRIFLSEILNALDNSILADTYTAGEESSEIRESVNVCVWEKLNGYLRDFTGQLSLADLTKAYKDNYIENREPMYYI
ncbi:MAG: Rrf2 family transcriptional regulator [Ruminococcus sp.]|nr:Rrf2 family transcriptional regulator [Ruminococcus sp.]